MTERLEKNWLEWSVFGVSLVLVLGTLAYLVYAAVTLGDQPPLIEIQLGAPEQRAGEFAVPVTVVNRGDQPAEGIQFAVTLESGGAEIERGEFSVPFLPRGATREGWVSFRTDPRTAQLKARVLGYESP
ncbi:MAG: hypothetical protein ACR2GW_01295 [Pyrinomonadaceae bacterium]